MEGGALGATAAGTLLGLGVFTTIGVWHGRAFALNRHFARLRRDAAHFDLEISFNGETLANALEDLLRTQNIERGIARITASARGDGRWNQTEGCDVQIQAMSTVEIDRTLLIDWSPFRIEARGALVSIKSTSYAESWLAWREAQKRGLDEAIRLSSAGALCEATRANIFWTQGETLFTPSLQSGCLPGIARELVLEWAREDGIPVKEGIFAPTELGAADAIFLSNAATGIRRATFANEQADDDAIFEHLAARWNEATQKGSTVEFDRTPRNN